MFAPTNIPLGVNDIGRPLGIPGMPEIPPQIEITNDHPPEADFDRSIDYYADYSGCGHWRLVWPGQMLNAHQKAVIHGTTMMVLDERYYQDTHTVRVQRQATEQQLQFIRLLKDFQTRQGFRIVYEIDDIIFHEDIPDYNKFKTAFTDPKIRECACEIMTLCDELTVTNKFMQEYYKEKSGNPNVTVIPNYPPRFWMGHYYSKEKVNKNFTKHRKKPRIIYAASGAHFDVDNRVKQRDDFFHVNQAVVKTVDKYQWVFIGAFPLSLHSLVAQGKIEFHSWQRLYEYPDLLASLEGNMFVAPLQDNTFNRAKSDLKYIEACCYGVPVACQDLCTYENAPLKFTTGDEMIDLIKYALKDRSEYMKISKTARAVADTRWLELDENIDKYAELYKLPRGHSERKNINSLAENK